MIVKINGGQVFEFLERLLFVESRPYKIYVKRAPCGGYSCQHGAAAFENPLV